jgi:folate-binding protein YgfZ
MSQGFSLGALTIVTLTGKDRNKIANNLCTQDLRSLADGGVTETFVTDARGRTLSHGLMVGLSDRLWYISSPGQSDRLVPHFDRYIIREDAAVADSSEDWLAYLFTNPDLLADSLKFPLPRKNENPNLGSASEPSCVTASRDGSVATVIRVPWIAGDGVLVLVPVSNTDDLLWQDVRSFCIPSDTLHREGWESSRIEAFWPWYGVDCDDRNLPQELDIDARAISFKKGCYLGQETVARLDALGQVQKKMVLLRIEGTESIVLPCPLRIDDKEIGTITSMATNARGERIALAMIRRSHFSVGTLIPFGDHQAVVIDH